MGILFTLGQGFKNEYSKSSHLNSGSERSGLPTGSMRGDIVGDVDLDATVDGGSLMTASKEVDRDNEMLGI